MGHDIRLATIYFILAACFTRLLWLMLMFLFIQLAIHLQHCFTSFADSLHSLSKTTRNIPSVLTTTTVLLSVLSMTVLDFATICSHLLFAESQLSLEYGNTYLVFV